jgi:BirA family biotin operon repressor/biotin-[acetyl-CoA-carboxylase] ligase
MSDAFATIEQWPARLEAAARGSRAFARVFVLRETDSTQDAARRHDPRTGDAFVAWRQTAGRGRLGRAWADTGEDGVAATLVVPRGPPERLAILAAVATAFAVEPLLQRSVGIKWPNDIVVEGRKLAGILIEQVDEVALIGVGINVRQRSWPPELATRAVSLHQLGVECDRLTVIERLIESIPAALGMTDPALVDAFGRRDVLRGTAASFLVAGQTVEGRVISVDPMRGLLVQSSAGDRWLPAALTSVSVPPSAGNQPSGRAAEPVSGRAFT